MDNKDLKNKITSIKFNLTSGDNNSISKAEYTKLLKSSIVSKKHKRNNKYKK